MKYLINYFTKSSTISKDKEILEIVYQKKPIEERLEKLIKTAMKKETGLFRHNKNSLLKQISQDKEMLSFIKAQEEKFLNGKITKIDFVDEVFKFARENKKNIQKYHFLLYVKKIIEEKLLNKPINLNKIIKDKNKIRDFMNEKIFSLQKKAIEYSLFQHKLSDSISKILKDIFNMEDLFWEEFIKKTEKLSKKIKNQLIRQNFNSKPEYLKKIVFKILYSEPITNKDIEEAINWQYVKKSFLKEANYNDITLKEKELEKIKKILIKTIRNSFIPPLREAVLEKIKKDKELNEILEYGPYFSVLKKIHNFIKDKNLDEHLIEDLGYELINYNQYEKFFNYNPDNLDSLKASIQNILSIEELDNNVKTTAKNFLSSIKQIKDLQKEEYLSIKERYETLKELLLTYHCNDKHIIENFSLLREEFKKTFLATTEETLNIYKNLKLSDIKIKTDKYEIVFDETARVFNVYNNNKKIASLPISSVMNIDRTGFKKEINLKYITILNDKITNNIEKLTVKNFDEINKKLKQNMYQTRPINRPRRENEHDRIKQ